MALPREHQEEETLGKADPLTGGLGYFFFRYMRHVCGLRNASSIGIAASIGKVASIGTEVSRYYCRAGIFGIGVVELEPVP